ncbi:hypothetical protein M8C21_031460 [Ambrosia artemisiifolia]|uniref:Protein kinase domain-containing protein n=1 Tax=Ambrosia artemisiifolia TaxID=4212 RepID=A0AAD5DBB8_AMBAR|nr:hypothetical protein M8C21_031460 [Ambrosia artemisiifolia]
MSFKVLRDTSSDHLVLPPAYVKFHDELQIPFGQPRANMRYCLHALARRSAKTHTWVVLFNTAPPSSSLIHVIDRIPTWIGIVGGKYKPGRKTGSGSFGEIHLATHVDAFEIVAVKIENNTTKHRQLLYEAKLYNLLRGGSGIPSIKWSGVGGEDNILVIDFVRTES